MPDRTIVVPSLYMGQIDGLLSIDSPSGETATMTLSVADSVLAVGETFRRGEGSRWSWLDAPETEVLATFGAFLAHAFESSDDDALDGWPILRPEASDWTDALALAGEDENN